MKVLYDFVPANTSDTMVTITASAAASGFPATNLKDIIPVKCYKTTGIDESFILYDFGQARTFNSLFINRFNFSAFTIQGNATNVWTNPSYNVAITGVAKDEIYEEYYMHYFKELVNFNYRYLRILIPGQTPLFEQTYFKVGNLLLGNSIEIWNPKPGYEVEIVPKINGKEYDSGYYEEVKIGRTKRQFSGQFDKISVTEYNKLRFFRTPFVLYHDWESDPTKCYLVKSSNSFKRTFDFAQITSHAFNFIEQV